MTDGNRLRALLARTAGAGSEDSLAVGLRTVLERLDATVLPRRLTIVARGGALRLDAMERRVLAVDGVAGLDEPDAASRIGVRLARHLAGDPWPRLSEASLPPESVRDPSRGLPVRAVAAALGIALWPDRSLAARLQAWVDAARPRAGSAVGYGALQDAGVGWGDADAVAVALARLARARPASGEPASEEPAALVALGLAGPAGGAGGEAAPGLVALAVGDGTALVVAGSSAGGVAVLAGLLDLPDLIRAWQAG